MKFTLAQFSCIIILLALLLPCSAKAESIALTNVTIIPMTGKGPLENRVVVIEDGKITAIQKRLKTTNENIRAIDCSGKYLIPGLWDMHVHLSGTGDSSLPLYIANGITGVRDMGGDYAELLRWRDEIAAGKRVGPRMKTAGPILESPAFIQRMQDRGVTEDVTLTRVGVGSPEEAEKAVQRVVALGVDFLKIRTFASRDTYLAIADAATKAGIALVGHADLSYEDMLAVGQASYEHFPRRLLNNKSEKERRAIWREMAQKNVAVVPTLINYDGSILVPIEDIERTVEDLEGSTDPRRRYVSPELLLSWREQVIDRKESTSRNMDKLIESSVRNLQEMHREGVRILPGTDASVVLMYPGFSLHEELAALVAQVGMTAEEALYRGTRYCAELLGLGDVVGTIEVGKVADLVLLNANPLDDIRNTTRIAALASQGKWYDRESLDNMLQEVASAVTAQSD